MRLSERKRERELETDRDKDRERERSQFVRIKNIKRQNLLYGERERGYRELWTEKMREYCKGKAGASKTPTCYTAAVYTIHK